jgi:predicted lipoprotein with Yx(FWY)xxD motif
MLALAMSAGCGTEGNPQGAPATTSPSDVTPASAPSVRTASPTMGASSAARERSVPSTPSRGSSTGVALVRATTNGMYGKIVVDANGYALYRFDNDSASPSQSNCDGSCASAWPPVQVTGKLTGAGVSASLGTITRADGRDQLTLGGWPLYRFVNDSKPGEVRGQGTGGVWWLVSPDGNEIKTGGA